MRFSNSNSYAALILLDSERGKIDEYLPGAKRYEMYAVDSFSVMLTKKKA